jgi:AcrR family transcriptional regulator
LSYKTPKDVEERKKENQKRILDTAAVIFAERGYHATTVKDVVNEAGMSVGSFYFYFKNKEDLLEKLYDLIVPLILKVLERDVSADNFGVIERICDVVTLTFAFFQERKELARVMLIEAIGITPDLDRKNAEGFKVLLSAIEKSLETFQKDNRIRTENIELTSMAMLGEVYFVMMNWLYGNTEPNLTDYAYPIAIHQLRAMSVEFEEETVKNYIEKLLFSDCCQ